MLSAATPVMWICGRKFLFLSSSSVYFRFSNCLNVGCQRIKTVSIDINIDMTDSLFCSWQANTLAALPPPGLNLGSSGS